MSFLIFGEHDELDDLSSKLRKKIIKQIEGKLRLGKDLVAVDRDKCRSLLRDLYFSMTDPLPVDWSEQMQAINRRGKILEEVEKYLGI